jgi:hypothetical protein
VVVHPVGGVDAPPARHGVDGGDVPGMEPAHEVEIVDAQNPERAGLPGEARDLRRAELAAGEDGGDLAAGALVDGGLEARRSGLEPFHVGCHGDDARLGHGVGHAAHRGHVGGDGFFDEDREARVGGGDHVRLVQAFGGRDDDGVQTACEERVRVGVDRCAEGGCACAVGVGVADGCKARATLGQDARVPCADSAGSDDAYAHGVGAT